MAIKYGYLVDPNKQFQYKNGKNLTSGYLRVFDANTDDPAPTYSNWQLTPNPQNITLDDNGRAVVICDSSKSYRLEVFSYDGELLWTIEPLTCMGGGGSSVSVGVQDIISTDQSVQVDIHNGIADLSADRGDPQVIVTSSNTLTEDGQFTFTTATSRSGNKLNISDGQVVSARQYIHFEATVALVWAGAANASTEVSLTCLDTTEKRDFDLSFAHTEYLDVSADYEVSTDNTPLYVTVLNLYPGMTATVENFSVHAVTKRYGDGSEYRAGNGILIQAGEISVDPSVVQEKLEAGANISIVGNVISATAEPQQPADWAATEGVTRILNKPDLDVYATHSEVTYGLAQKQDTISDLSTIRSGAAAGATAVQPSEMDSALAGKQDVINDLSTIRSGAAKGATSVQPADLAPYAVASDVETALAGKQDTISDLSTIRSGASAGATAVQPATMNSALAGKQDTISDLATIRSGAASGATAVQPATMNSALAGKQDTIADLSDIRSGAAAGATAVQPAALEPYALTSDVNTVLAGKQDVISDLSTIRSGASAGATAVQPGDLATVATTGAYSDLSGTPTIPTVDQIYDGTSANAQSGVAVASAISGKQDTISDLSTIRNGAAAGATAVQPADLDPYAMTSDVNTALAGKQDSISDLATIRSGAAAGATAVQPADMNTALAGKQDVISDLSAIRSGAASGATAVQPATMNTALALKEDAANKSQTLDPTSATQFPSSAATASFVNSSVATNTATFRGNFNLTDLGLTYPATNAQIEAALDAHTWPVGVVPTNNDYVYVEIENPQTTGIDDVVERFKYDGTYWHYEYTLNNSSFTAAEKAAIDSGIDSAKVAIYDAHVANGDIHVTATEKATWNAKQDAISDLSTIRSGAAAGVTAVQPGDLATVATTGAYGDLSGTPTVEQTYDGTSANAQSGVAVAGAIAGKQDTISDLSTIRSGAAAGATAVQPGDLATVATTGAYSDLSGTPAIPVVDQTYDANSTNAQSGVSVASAVSTKQDTISDLSTIRSGAAAGATAVQPGDLATVATTGAYSDLSGTPTIPTVDQTYNAASANAQSGVAVASAISGKQDTISDLSTIRSGAAAGATAVQPGDLSAVATTGAYSDLSGTPTVDQTYSAASTNAQSGVAVASAIAGVNAVPASTSSDADKVLTVDAQGVPGWANAQAPISAGSGIDITNNVVSAKVDGSTIGTNSNGELESLVTQTNADWDAVSGVSEILNKPVPKTLSAGAGISITENQSTITIANTAPDVPIGSWEDVSTEAQFNTTPILAGTIEIKYNATLKLVSVTADVNLDAGAAGIFTWSNRLKPVANAFALGNALNLYVSQTGLTQPANATNRWVNGVWMWPVVGGN